MIVVYKWYNFIEKAKDLENILINNNSKRPCL